MTAVWSRTAVCGLVVAALCAPVSNASRALGEPAPGEAAGGPAGAASVPSATYGPLQASEEAHQRAEAERRAAIRRQLQTLDNLAWYSGASGPAAYGARTAPSLESIYADPRVWRMTQFGMQAERRSTLPYRGDSRSGVFEPWPLVPGDVFAAPWFDRVQQPAGHEIVVTGRNSYLYRPVYPAEVPPAGPTSKPPGAKLPAPPAANPPPISSPSRDASRGVIPPPPAPARELPPSVEGGPREF